MLAQKVSHSARSPFSLVREEGHDERRSAPRYKTLYRVARVHREEDQGLARLHNISDGGLMLSSKMAVREGEQVQIDLSDAHHLTGTVKWLSDGRYGVELPQALDSVRLLKSLYDDRVAGVSRPMRLPLARDVLVASERGVKRARLCDISQGGLKLTDEGFAPGLPVKVYISGKMERRGVVRWTANGLAGVALRELIGVDDLGSIQQFNRSDSGLDLI